MKYLTQISLLTFSLIFMASTVAIAQNNDRGNRGNSEDRGKIEKKENRQADSLDVRQDSVNRNADSVRAQNNRANRQADSLKRKRGNAPNQDNNGQGNAYGRDKGDMTGREFGQARAAAARNLNNEVERMENNIITAEETVSRARTEIEQAEESVEEEQNDERRQTRIEQIEKAKEQLSDLEQVIQREKEKVQNARKKLEEIFNENAPGTSSDTNEENEEIESDEE